jgi:hypothetical protein
MRLEAEMMTVRGKASDHSELFEFTIEPFVGGGYRLDIRYSGDCHHNITGAGIWPTVQKAQSIAEETARRLLHGAIVNWEPD